MNIEQLINDYENQLSELEERIEQCNINTKELIKKYKKEWDKYGMGSSISYSQVVSELEELLINKQK